MISHARLPFTGRAGVIDGEEPGSPHTGLLPSVGYAGAVRRSTRIVAAGHPGGSHEPTAAGPGVLCRGGSYSDDEMLGLLGRDLDDPFTLIIGRAP